MSALLKEILLATSILVSFHKHKSKYHSVVQHLGHLLEFLRAPPELLGRSTCVLPCVHCLDAL